MQRWLPVPLLLCLLLVAAPRPLEANRCSAACRQRARQCKERCKVKFPSDWLLRHRCKKQCRLRERACRTRC